MITPRTTRLVRVPDLRAFRGAVAALACEGSPLEVGDRLVIVPTHAAAAHLLRSIEGRSASSGTAIALPALTTSSELTTRLAERLPRVPPLLTDAEREALLGVACRVAREEGVDPPFRLRPGLIAEILRFYDALRRNQKDVATFERLALGALEPGAAIDRGAERLVRQTRFLGRAFRHFEERCANADAGAYDEHTLRAELLATPAPQPWRHVVVTVLDRARDPHGLWPVDWDLLSRLPGLARLDLVVTDRTLAGAFHERIHQLLPGIEETRVEPVESVGPPRLLVPPTAGLAHVARDREEEVAGFARWVKQSARTGEIDDPERVALVVRQPLPYVYVGREILQSAGIPCQMFDALPLAGEPYAAALDLLMSFVGSNFGRVPGIALLSSPHLRVHGDTNGGAGDLKDVAALDRALSEAGYLGEHDALMRIVNAWRAGDRDRGLLVRASRAGETLARIAGELRPLRRAAPVADHLSALLSFLETYEHLPGPDDPLRVRQLRARAAILGTMGALRDAYRRFDAAPVEFDEVAAMVRRWIDAQTFSPRTGDAGVHVVDAESARFGDFDHVQLAGLVDGEWPDRPRRNIFYSPGILRDLGWTAESERLEGARASFADLMRLPGARLRVSAFSLEDDSVVAPSTLLDEVEAAGFATLECPPDPTLIFDYEALSAGAPSPAVADSRYRGTTDGHVARALSLSALERYQECPFRFFAADVLRLEEAPEDEPSLSPRARGRFIHEVFQRFFEAWDGGGHTAITADRFDAARSLFEEVAAPLLAQLPEAEAGIERARLFGSAIAVGVVDVVLGLEASRPAEVEERWLEWRFEGEFELGTDGRRVLLKGVADRVDLLSGNRLRVVDYKSGSPPDVKRALQVPIYALCAQETLVRRDGRPWVIDEGSYVAFTGKRTLVPVMKAGAGDHDATLTAARERLFAVLDGIAAGEFPPRPHQTRTCTYCAYASVCRKDYAGDE